MSKVNFNEEKRLWKQRLRRVVGLDEAGRGPLAGPVVAGAVIVRHNSYSLFKNITINDSKKLSEKQREFLYEKLTNDKNIVWGVGIVSEKIIDKINILEASKLAMQKAIDGLWVSPEFLLLDGNFKINSNIQQKPIIKGDSKVFSICLAGIIAKVTRDRIMQKMHTKYPQYGFDKHKGYGTALHIKNIKSFGACKIHRKTFYPVSSIARI
ncbi:MAG: ribonuclease HII [Candidatus Staskawiczbacteria bacterium]|nr:ribonuclease HII [Candidatus Staskawiczbacteria bacterium]